MAAACALCQITPSVGSPPLCLGCAQDLPWRGVRLQVQDLSIQVAYDYAWPIDRVIQRYKYHAQLPLAAILTAGLQQLVRPEVDALLAVPLSAKRLRQRGFNQSHLLAQQLACHWQLPLLSCIERRSGIQQQGLSRSERLLNLTDAFSLRPKSPALPARIALLDDVLTTGSTLLHLADFLKSQGVAQVEALVVASRKHA
jgi:ComF family protein